jgi:hypothetical protein
VARVIISNKKSGSIRLKRILQLGGKLADTNEEGDAIVKHTREEDMPRRVLGVLAAVSTKIPLSVFGNDYFRQYTRSLDPKHRPPNHLETNRIIEVAMDLAILEVNRILADCRDRIGEQFLSISTDFWTDSVRKQSFGALVASMVAEKYRLSDGRELYMSRETAKRNEAVLLSVS